MTPLADALQTAATASGFSGVFSIDTAGGVDAAHAYGLAHRALGVANDVGMRYAIASGGKLFTALATLSLIDDGTLTLDTTARSILGADLPLIDDAVTIEHLLGHRSGIGDYIDEEADWDVEDYVLSAPVQNLDTTEAFLPLIDGFPQAFPPDERFAYCNGGYIVLALLSERASGIPYHRLVEERVLAKAGLERTGFLRSDELPGDAAIGYLGDASDRTNVFHLPVRGNGDGGIYSSTSDLSRMWAALVDGQIVAPATVALMTTPRSEDPGERMRYGLGMYLHATGPHLVITGYDAGVSFWSRFDPRTRQTISILANTSEGAWPLVKVAAASE
jgi:CubicO group peptidase (beta-lactamase class C family)